MSENILKQLLSVAVKNNASDLHLLSSDLPTVRINGSLRPLKIKGLDITPEIVEAIIRPSLSAADEEVLKNELEVDYLYTFDNQRFRVNAFMSQGKLEAVFRVIKNDIENLSNLNIPASVEDLTKNKNGLILVVGPTGSGKTTTLAGLIDIINDRESYSIITIENPVEFLHKRKNSIISQREIGIDTVSFPKALRSALRQDPDVIVIGEIRDKETATIALEAAQTGHLVLATLHASDVSDACSRFMNLFPDNEKDLTRMMFAETLRAIVAQRLVKDIQQQRIPLVEVLVKDLRIEDIINGKDNNDSIYEAVKDGSSKGMQTFEDSIVSYLQQQRIDLETAESNATNLQSLKLRIRSMGLG